MQINPYESPRVPQPGQEQEFADSNSIRQLLVEIRDGQRELLQLQRDALKAQLGFRRFGWASALIPVLMFGVVFAISFYFRTAILRRPTPTITPPPQTAPRSVPRPVPSSPANSPVTRASDKAAD